MKQQVKRSTLSGGWQAITFAVKSRAFFVKNYTDDVIYVSFANDGDVAGAFSIYSGIGEEVYINSSADARAEMYVDTIYVYGTGEIEVEATDF